MTITTQICWPTKCYRARQKFYDFCEQIRRTTGLRITDAEIGRFLIETALDNISHKAMVLVFKQILSKQ